MRGLASLAHHNELYTHIGLIPLFSIAIIYIKRLDIFERVEFAPVAGGTIISAGLLLLLAGSIYRAEPGSTDFLALSASGYVLWLIGFFTTLYGLQAFRRAMFPLFFLFFSVPIPQFMLDQIIAFLQHMTTETVDVIFALLGVPYLRTGTLFQLPDVTIEVARQCSGIRSSLALIIATTAAGFVFLETGWRRLLLVLAIIPITIFKNALRIATLTLMASHIDPSWLTDSWLHRAGGKPFFVFALLLWSPLLWLMWRSEKKPPATTGKRSSVEVGEYERSECCIENFNSH
jgi:exosortase